MSELTEQQRSTRFKNRRRMAWLSLGMISGFLCGVAYRLFVVGDSPTAWNGVTTVLLGSLTGIVLSYVGAAAYEHVRQKQ